MSLINNYVVTKNNKYLFVRKKLAIKLIKYVNYIVKKLTSEYILVLLNVYKILD